MKPLSLTACVIGLTVLCGRAQEEEGKLDDVKSRGSYSIGYNVGFSLVSRDAEVDESLLIQGLRDALHSNTPKLTNTEMREAMNEFRTALNERRADERRIQGEQNKAEAEEFFAENQSKEGVVTLPSGLQYQVLEEGEGESPNATDQVNVTYAGRLLDGTEFDSGTTSFPVNRVIKGWTEALQLMKPGSKWRLFIPPDLGYGERGSGNKIGPNAGLVFDVELHSVEETAAASRTPRTRTSRQPVTSDIIKVPSAEELKKGAQIQVIKKEDVPKEIEKQKQLQQQKENQDPE